MEGFAAGRSQSKELSSRILAELAIGKDRVANAPANVAKDTNELRTTLEKDVTNKVNASEFAIKSRIESLSSPYSAASSMNPDVSQVPARRRSTEDYSKTELYAGIDSMGNVCIWEGAESVPKDSTVLFHSKATTGWTVETTSSPDLSTPYFASIRQLDKNYAKAEQTAIDANSALSNMQPVKGFDLTGLDERKQIKILGLSEEGQLGVLPAAFINYSTGESLPTQLYVSKYQRVEAASTGYLATDLLVTGPKPKTVSEGFCIVDPMTEIHAEGRTLAEALDKLAQSGYYPPGMLLCQSATNGFTNSFEKAGVIGATTVDRSWQKDVDNVAGAMGYFSLGCYASGIGSGVGTATGFLSMGWFSFRAVEHFMKKYEFEGKVFDPKNPEDWREAGIIMSNVFTKGKTAAITRLVGMGIVVSADIWQFADQFSQLKGDKEQMRRYVLANGGQLAASLAMNLYFGKKQFKELRAVTPTKKVGAEAQKEMPAEKPPETENRPSVQEKPVSKTPEQQTRTPVNEKPVSKEPTLGEIEKEFEIFKKTDLADLTGDLTRWETLAANMRNSVLRTEVILVENSLESAKLLAATKGKPIELNHGFETREPWTTGLRMKPSKVYRAPQKIREGLNAAEQHQLDSDLSFLNACVETKDILIAAKPDVVLFPLRGGWPIARSIRLAASLEHQSSELPRFEYPPASSHHFERVAWSEAEKGTFRSPESIGRETISRYLDANVRDRLAANNVTKPKIIIVDEVLGGRSLSDSYKTLDDYLSRTYGKGNYELTAIGLCDKTRMPLVYHVYGESNVDMHIRMVREGKITYVNEKLNNDIIAGKITPEEFENTNEFKKMEFNINREKFPELISSNAIDFISRDLKALILLGKIHPISVYDLFTVNSGFAYELSGTRSGMPGYTANSFRQLRFQRQQHLFSRLEKLHEGNVEAWRREFNSQAIVQTSTLKKQSKTKPQESASATQTAPAAKVSVQELDAIILNPASTETQINSAIKQMAELGTEEAKNRLQFYAMETMGADSPTNRLPKGSKELARGLSDSNSKTASAPPTNAQLLEGFSSPDPIVKRDSIKQILKGIDPARGEDEIELAKGLYDELFRLNREKGIRFEDPEPKKIDRRRKPVPEVPEDTNKKIFGNAVARLNGDPAAFDALARNIGDREAFRVAVSSGLHNYAFNALSRTIGETATLKMAVELFGADNAYSYARTCMGDGRALLAMKEAGVQNPTNVFLKSEGASTDPTVWGYTEKIAQEKLIRVIKEANSEPQPTESGTGREQPMPREVLEARLRARLGS